ncbi:hypothetical protein FXF65_17305 [Actinomadura syzygii]|uniref:Leucine-rich repeat domain-containing protein n=1 Tax=Actinomadura syzygii TaxID=1427538 RepID=A0A5D0U9Y5_9ACTN|nr:hypothetical protein FXF65_17305 [Actinomadura syzygii]
MLSRGPGDGPWDLARLTEQYLQGGHDGLNMRFTHPAAFKSLDFLEDCTGLRYLEVNGRIRDDLASFRLPDLRELVLLTRSPRAIPGFAAAGLTRLGIDDRPGKEHIAELRQLRELLIWYWKGTDLSFLGDAPPPLRSLRLEGRKQLATLDGIEGCRDLSELWVRDAQVESLEPLRELTGLRVLRLMPGYQPKVRTRLDLSVLTGMKGLETIALVYTGEIVSLRPLRELPALREVRIRADILDGDLSPLDDLPADAVVVRPDE